MLTAVYILSVMVIGLVLLNFILVIKLNEVKNQAATTERQLNNFAKRFVKFKGSYTKDLEADIAGLQVMDRLITRIDLLEHKVYKEE